MILYLDTSALIKLYAEEPGTEEVRDACGRAELAAISEIGYVEARSALARRERDGSLSEQEHGETVEHLEHDFSEFYLLRRVSGEIIAQAGELVRRHALRAYDAVHLATALELLEEARDLYRRQQQPAEELQVWLLSYDSALRKAAGRENLTREETN